MEENRGDFIAGREQTDASLDEERAAADTAKDRAVSNAQRRLYDLIERERFLADERLMKFRENADLLIALERMASPPASQRVELERLTADKGVKAERKAADALLHRERGRVDAHAEIKRRTLDEDLSEQESQRQNTNENLSDERSGADVLVTALDRMTDALMDSQANGGRRDDVLAMVTHDLRSPLTVIVANAAFITEETEEDATRDAAEDMLAAATRMGRLLADLLDVAQIEAGVLRIERGVHDVGALLTEVLQSYRPLFAARAITFTIHRPEAPFLVPFDHDRLIQLLSNLLGNAMRFTPSGGEVELHAEGREGEVILMVRDSGPGIGPESLPRVFERFWKGKGEAQRGLGLGLYICRRIAEAHGGSISVESTLGEGAEFRVSLPLPENGAGTA